MAAVYQNNWLEPVLCNIDTNFRDTLLYRYDGSATPADNKEKFLEFLILPIDKRNELDSKYITQMIDDVYKLQIPAEAKAAFIRYTETIDKAEIQKLRGQVVYCIFNSEMAFGIAKSKEENIDAWYKCIKEILEPQIGMLTESDQQKIVALLAREKAELDQKLESQSLFERLMDYM